MTPHRRDYRRTYHHLLPEYYPIKLIGAFIAADFVVGCPFGCRFCISRRHPSREELFDAEVVIDARVPEKKMLAWLSSTPSFRAGVQIRIGHDTDAGLQFGKASGLLPLLDPDKSVTYLTRKPFSPAENAFFSRPHPNLLLKLTASPRSEALGITADPLALVESARGIDDRQMYWVVGPLAHDSGREAERVLEALPPGSHLFLKQINTAGIPAVKGVAPLSDADYGVLLLAAERLGHTVTEFFCRRGLARVGRGFFDVDKITGQAPGPKRDRELAVCSDCPSRGLCHGELDEEGFRRQLRQQLEFLELTPVGEPVRTGPRSFTVNVAEPSSRGEETYLSHAIHPPVSIVLSTRETGRSQGGSFCNVHPAVLRRWYRTGFLPVTELNNVAQNTLGDILKLFETRNHGSRHFHGGLPHPPAGSGPAPC